MLNIKYKNISVFVLWGQVEATVHKTVSKIVATRKHNI